MKTKHLRIIGATIFTTFFLSWLVSFITQAVMGYKAYYYALRAMCCAFELFGISLEILAWRIEKKDRKDGAENEQ